MTAAGLAARPIVWRRAEVVEVIQETSRVKTLVLDVPDWPGHRAGEHVDVRLTAPDGYQAERSYSIASPPEDKHLALTIEQLEDGEVSSYLCGELRVGDTFELRGPIGGYFIWETSEDGPLFLVGGGSGIVPLMAMLRHRAAALRTPEERRAVPARLLYSSREWNEVIYRDELARLTQQDDALQVTHTITRMPPDGWHGFTRRVDRAMIEVVSWPPLQRPHIFICGPTPLVESAANACVELGHDPVMVKTERFGPTG